MLLKRLLLAGTLVGLTVALSFPHPHGDRTIFVLSSGGLSRPVSFDSDMIGPARGWWWHAQQRVPRLVGTRYRMQIYDSASPSAVMLWTYVPQASGALSVIVDGRGHERTVWMAFTPAFNVNVITQLDGPLDPVDAQGVLELLAIGTGVLLLMTVAGFRFYTAPLWLLRAIRHDAHVLVAADAGPAYLYTSVPRSQWASMGRLGHAPRTRTGTK